MARITAQQTPQSKVAKAQAKGRPTITAKSPVVQVAYERWLKGEKRGDLAQELRLGIGYGKLGKLFRELTGKTWSELKALRSSGKPKGRKKANAGQQKAA